MENDISLNDVLYKYIKIDNLHWIKLVPLTSKALNDDATPYSTLIKYIVVYNSSSSNHDGSDSDSQLRRHVKHVIKKRLSLGTNEKNRTHSVLFIYALYEPFLIKIFIGTHNRVTYK